MTIMMIALNSTVVGGGSGDTQKQQRPTQRTTIRRRRKKRSSTLWLLFVYILSSFTGSHTLSSTTAAAAAAFVLVSEHAGKPSHCRTCYNSAAAPTVLSPATFSFSRTNKSCWFSPACPSSYWSQQSSVSSPRHHHQRQQSSSSSSSSSFLVLWMGKGDGKKKRKKKSNSGSTASSSTSSAGGSTSSRASVSTSSSSSSSSSATTTFSTSSPSPLRVTTNSLVPVRRQLLYAKLNKEFFKQSSAGFRQKRVRTKYRRTWDDEEIELKAEERKRKGQEPDWDVILSRNSVNPLVIVDGYNIIFQWKRLKKHMLKGDLQHARQLLIDDLENLRVIKGWRIEVVFDGRRRSTIGPLGHGPVSVLSSNSATTMTTLGQVTRGDQQAKASVSKHGVRVVFSGVGMEADTYIESRCVKAKNITNGSFTGSFIVATDDAMIRLAGQSAGAMCMSADRFVTELKAVKQTVSYRVEAAVAKVNGHGIRPEKLRGTAPVRFGRGSVLIEDRRNRTTVKQRKELEQLRWQAHAVTIDRDSIVDFSQVPTNLTKKTYYGQ